MIDGVTVLWRLDLYTAIPQPPQVQAAAKICLCSLVTLLLFGCKTLTKDKGEKSDAAQQPGVMKIPVGTIHMVDPQGRFVLVRSSRTFQVESGTRMTSYASDGTVTGIFEVSPARKGAFLTADLLQGTPKSGEQVLMDYAQPVVPQSGEPGTLDFGAESDVQILE